MSTTGAAQTRATELRGARCRRGRGRRSRPGSGRGPGLDRRRGRRERPVEGITADELQRGVGRRVAVGTDHAVVGDRWVERDQLDVGVGAADRARAGREEEVAGDLLGEDRVGDGDLDRAVAVVAGRRRSGSPTSYSPGLPTSIVVLRTRHRARLPKLLSRTTPISPPVISEESRINPPSVMIPGQVLAGSLSIQLRRTISRGLAPKKVKLTMPGPGGVIEHEVRVDQLEALEAKIPAPSTALSVASIVEPRISVPNSTDADHLVRVGGRLGRRVDVDQIRTALGLDRVDVRVGPLRVDVDVAQGDLDGAARAEQAATPPKRPGTPAPSPRRVVCRAAAAQGPADRQPVVRGSSSVAKLPTKVPGPDVDDVTGIGAGTVRGQRLLDRRARQRQRARPVGARGRDVVDAGRPLRGRGQDRARGERDGRSSIGDGRPSGPARDEICDQTHHPGIAATGARAPLLRKVNRCVKQSPRSGCHKLVTSAHSAARASSVIVVVRPAEGPATGGCSSSSLGDLFYVSATAIARPLLQLLR